MKANEIINMIIFLCICTFSCGKNRSNDESVINIDCRPDKSDKQKEYQFKVNDRHVIQVLMENEYGYELIIEAPARSLQEYGKGVMDEIQDNIWYYPFMGDESVRSDEEKFPKYLARTVAEKYFKFRTNELTLIPFGYRSQKQKVFNTAGSYLLYVSKNFGRTTPAHHKVCNIQFSYENN